MAQPFQSTHFRNLNDTGQNVSNGRCHIVKFIVTNSIAAATAFVQIFNVAAASVTLGTTVPLFVIHVPAASATVGGTVEIGFELPGLLFETRCSVFGTTTAEGSTGTADGLFLQAFVN